MTLADKEAQNFAELTSVEHFHDACGVGFLVNRQGVASHALLEKSFVALQNLSHRGAVDADGKTGDGCGILTAVPHAFYLKKAQEAGVIFADREHFAVMIIFYPVPEEDRRDCRHIVEKTLAKYHLSNMWTRAVPVNRESLGRKALGTCPDIEQRFIAKPPRMTPDEFERELHFLRKELDILVTDGSYREFYVPSVSARTIVHKGMFMGEGVREFYLDLQDEDFVSSHVIFHQRYSTNTFPRWALAHPFRMIAHNGEINTVRANRNWMEARSIADQPRSWVPEQNVYSRVILARRSDSASLDNMLEAYVHAGRSVLHALAHMIPEAWQNQPHLNDDLKSFYEYHACLSEPWDGPAAVVFCDGRYIGAMLDRNGLRPMRYKVTANEFFGCSEVGCVPFADEDILENGKLSPGQMIAFDLSKKRLLKNNEIKAGLAAQKPYRQWVHDHIVTLENLVTGRAQKIPHQNDYFSGPDFQKQMVGFAYTEEDLERILLPMCTEGNLAMASMGDDTPLAFLSARPQPLYNYFKQIFAQVTNPPIDPIREENVMSLWMYLGQSGNIFEESPEHARQIKIASPILVPAEFAALCSRADFKSVVLNTLFAVSEGPDALHDILVDLCLAAEKAVADGAKLVVLSDRGVDKAHAPIPMLLAVSAVHQHLIRAGTRLDISLVVETGEAREVHHHACLIGFGASVICPYLALQVARDLALRSGLDPAKGASNYIRACEKGLYKIMSKMGIATLQSYHASQLFEIIGLKESLIHTCFTGALYRLEGGVDLTQVARDTLVWHAAAFSSNETTLKDAGLYRYRREGEYHANNPQMVVSLHRAVAKNDAKAFAEYVRLIDERDPVTIRDLLRVRFGTPVPIGNVESTEKIVQRFCTPGISYGAISKEVHEDFAIAMNRLGAKSDSGEGGEDPLRFEPLPSGDSKNSAIKQVASGRFGVTAYYLSRARELEIKIAQGAKPGEGGQLPGHKVSVEIARVRHAIPGVTLISPPPHHDIYSIEDLSQLIYDLKRVNPRAKVCVKLVSEAGIGTIAAGVAKAHADVILISGHDGGTGASPLDSIRHTGLPWELGLAEVQRALVANDLRGRVLLRTDGGLKTGLDVIKAALFGAEEFGFGTAAMIAAGCKMVRACHLNTCPVGVATQDPGLRKKYVGTPERIVSFFLFVAGETRRLLSMMGFVTLDEIIGRVDLFEQLVRDLPRKNDVDLRPLLLHGDVGGVAIKNTQPRNDWVGDEKFDDVILPEVSAILATGNGEKNLSREVHNTERSIGARLSYEIVSRFGPEGLPQGKICLNLGGTAGQSFGAFLAKTIEMHLEGEANDYVGKGLSGGILSLRPSRLSRFVPEDNIICGNTCLYGATSGKLFVNGRAGERFAVRNSGAQAVVEGIGDHGCEYMTGGHVLILGPVGHNFGAGMTGGVACVYDPDKLLTRGIHVRDVSPAVVHWSSAEAHIFFALFEEHLRITDSPLASRLMKNWSGVKSQFLLVKPKLTA